MDARPARTGVSGRLGAALLLAVLLCVGSPVLGQDEEQGICPPRLLTFRSLKHGEFDYCRMHLRYRPGTYDCLRIVAPTCNFVVDGRRRPGLTLGSGSELFGTAERIVCPPGPPAPSCPAGYPDAPIPRP